MAVWLMIAVIGVIGDTMLKLRMQRRMLWASFQLTDNLRLLYMTM